MKKHYFIYSLFLAYSCSVFAVESVSQDAQVKYTSQAIESSIDDDIDENNDDDEVIVPKKPTVLDSLRKVVTLKWGSLNRDDAWNIGATVTLVGVGCYVFSSCFKKTGFNNPIINHPPHKPFQGNSVEHSKIVNCSICLDEKKGVECHAMSCCKGEFCGECLFELIDTALQEKSIKNLECPNVVCQRRNNGEKIQYTDMQIICESCNRNDLFNAYLDAATKDLLDKEANVKQCPTRGCESRFTIEQGPNGEMTCNGCKKKYCTGCLHKHDLKITCDQAKAQRELTENPNFANKANEDWIKANTKNCPNPRCKHGIQKNGGCNHMTCERCKHQFCWNCLANYQPNGGCSSFFCAKKQRETGNGQI